MREWWISRKGKSGLSDLLFVQTRRKMRITGCCKRIGSLWRADFALRFLRLHIAFFSCVFCVYALRFCSVLASWTRTLLRFMFRGERKLNLKPKKCSYHLLTLFYLTVKMQFEIGLPNRTCKLILKWEMLWLKQGILKGEVSLYHWPPVCLVWISLFFK